MFDDASWLQSKLIECQRQRDDLLTALQAVMGDHIGHVPTEVYCEWCMASVSCSAESRVDQVSSIEHDADCPFAAMARARSGSGRATRRGYDE